MAARFADRRDAGAALAERLAPSYAGRNDVVVLGLPRGGVIVAAPVAARLRAPLDVLVVRKLGAPGRPELALGALASGGVRVVDEELASRVGASPEAVAAVAEREAVELARRETAYRAGRQLADITGRTALLVDDGFATGASIRAAVLAATARHPAAVVAAAPVGSRRAVETLRPLCADVVVLEAPAGFRAVSLFYDRFEQTSDEEVAAALAAS